MFFVKVVLILRKKAEKINRNNQDQGKRGIFCLMILFFKFEKQLFILFSSTLTKLLGNVLVFFRLQMKDKRPGWSPCCLPDRILYLTWIHSISLGAANANHKTDIRL